MQNKEQLTNAVMRYRSGDAAAFNTIYEITKDNFYTCAIYLMRDDQLAQDLLQDTYVEIAKSIRNLKDVGAFTTWSRRIMYYRANHVFAKMNREEPAISEDASENAADLFDQIQEEDLSAMHSLPELTIPAQTSENVLKFLSAKIGLEGIKIFAAQGSQTEAYAAEQGTAGHSAIHSAAGTAGTAQVGAGDTAVHSAAGAETPAIHSTTGAPQGKASGHSLRNLFAHSGKAGEAGKTGMAAKTATAAGGAADKGILAGIGTKIMAGVLAAAVAVGGGYGVYRHSEGTSDTRNTETVEEDTVEESAEDTFASELCTSPANLANGSYAVTDGDVTYYVNKGEYGNIMKVEDGKETEIWSTNDYKRQVVNLNIVDDELYFELAFNGNNSVGEEADYDHLRKGIYKLNTDGTEFNVIKKSSPVYSEEDVSVYYHDPIIIGERLYYTKSENHTDDDSEDDSEYWLCESELDGTGEQKLVSLIPVDVSSTDDVNTYGGQVTTDGENIYCVTSDGIVRLDANGDQSAVIDSSQMSVGGGTVTKMIAAYDAIYYSTFTAEETDTDSDDFQSSYDCTFDIWKIDYDGDNIRNVKHLDSDAESPAVAMYTVPSWSIDDGKLYLLAGKPLYDADADKVGVYRSDLDDPDQAMEQIAVIPMEIEPPEGWAEEPSGITIENDQIYCSFQENGGGVGTMYYWYTLDIDGNNLTSHDNLRFGVESQE